MQGIYTDHTGEEKMMNCSMKARITKYRNANDIDVQFEDGTVREHKAYRSFTKGNIYNPNVIKDNRKKERIGETRMMNCGMPCTITEYRRHSDIDVQFEDGTEIFHRTYYCFVRGNIYNPNARVGETKMMNCDMKARITKYRYANDMDVQFEDGTVKEHVTYHDFKKGTLTPTKRKNYSCNDHLNNSFKTIQEKLNIWHITGKYYCQRINNKMSEKDALETPMQKINGFNIKNTELLLDNENKIFGNIYFCTCKKCGAPYTGWREDIKECENCKEIEGTK